MFKKIALAAFAAASMAAMAQNSDWQKYDTYNIGKTDLNGASTTELWRIAEHDLKGVNANDAYLINSFISNAPEDESNVITKAIALNYKQASMVRDEVAMARYGQPDTYAWLSYPPLTWSSTPGQNSWSNLTFTDTAPSMAMNNDVDVNITDDQSRAMRMVMRNHGRRDVDYDRALWILGSNLSETERGILHNLFHPTLNDPYEYTNESLLEALIRVVESNASMVDHLDRFAWYNHFDTNYYNGRHYDW